MMLGKRYNLQREVPLSSEAGSTNNLGQLERPESVAAGCGTDIGVISGIC
jgi:hypothetical protein